MAKALFDETILTYSDELEKDISKYGKPDIGIHIVDNLKNELREYQQKALQHYLQNEKINNPKKHLMFNMATGSGKTLIMAALILDCYKKGYRNFIFFVNSTAILEKTKINFADPSSSKYLYKDKIIIDGKRVDINIINNLDDSEENSINIYFSTIQGLFSLFTNERENSITLDDLKDKKLVFLADEAHHLNASTKSEKEDIKSWETIIKKAYNSHPKNLLYEFSATIPKDINVLNKYKDVIVFKYDLKRFCKEGFSKRILLSKYENREINSRFLGAILLNIYRETLASKNNIFLKPVVLFKSETIVASNQNQEKFINLLNTLTGEKINEFYNLSHTNKILQKNKEFFKEFFGNSYLDTLANLLKNSFKEEFLINVNNLAEVENNQILLNSLEDRDNPIRAIFAVDKLNEGWDVLNLFDIVRLGDGKKSSSVTTKEAQLIGRGARYYPFGDNESKYIRKFDDDLDNPLSIIEQLIYHTTNDVDYISNLNKSMEENGLFVEFEKDQFVLKPTKRAEQITSSYEIYYISNKRNKKDSNSLFNTLEKDSIEHNIRSINIPLFSDDIISSDIFDEENAKLQIAFKNSKKLNNYIDFNIFQKAFNKVGLDFNEISTKFNVKSKIEFYEYISSLEFLFDKKQIFTPKNNLRICEHILKNLKTIMLEKDDEYEVTDFGVKKLNKENFKDRIIIRQKGNVLDAREWMYYDKYSYDSGLENKFIEFIEQKKEQIDAVFKHWIIFRNDNFSEFKIYDNRVIDGKKSPTYATGFEPDFIFFGIRHDDEKSSHLKNEYIFEPKGGHLSGKDGTFGTDKWKEELLTATTGNHKNIKVVGFPFFKEEKYVENIEFLEKFNEIFK